MREQFAQLINLSKKITGYNAGNEDGADRARTTRALEPAEVELLMRSMRKSRRKKRRFGRNLAMRKWKIRKKLRRLHSQS